MKPGIIIFAAVLAVSCSGWTAVEEELIGGSPEVMRVLSIDDDADRSVLRSVSRDIPAKAIGSETYTALCRKLVSTVTDPSQDGVGIAGPQVGIRRRIIAVQRFDKPGEPFEVYPNIRITEMRGTPEPGPEGCLSLPDRRGMVLRSRDISITYTSERTLTDTTETVTGFTAVIFQHECDHLDGIVFTDRIWGERDSWYRGAPSSDGTAASPDSAAAGAVADLPEGIGNDGSATPDAFPGAGFTGTLAAESAIFPKGSAPADVLYLVSTNVSASFDDNGNELFNARLTPDELERIDRELSYAQTELFGDSLNFYSPRYHLVTMNGFDQPDADIYFRRASAEVLDAFDYYIKHENNGRPFVLAGFSQGAMMVLEILKHIRPEDYTRMLAAYVIGYGIGPEDAACEFIRPATGPDDIGACYSHNTVTDTCFVWPKVWNNSVCCINPANWRTDSTPATFDFGGQSITAAIDTTYNVIVAKGLNDPWTNEPVYGCLHVQDLLFFSPHIRRNALGRVFPRAAEGGPDLAAP